MHIINFCKHSFVFMACALVLGAADAAQATNARGAGGNTATASRGTGATGATSRGVSGGARAAASGASRATVARTGTVTARTPGVLRNVKTVASSTGRSAVNVRAATPITARGTMSPNRSGAEVSRGTSKSSASRAGVARATAVFEDISKLGSGYSACRDAYATCMDQFCAKANDTYRRCFCSSRYTEFRDTEYALDQAKTLLMRFEDTSLAAVDKTAAEAEAMYTATIGEAAIKNDTSAAAKTLAEITDLLSGKKRTEATAQTTSTNSLGVLSFDFSVDVDDVWSGGDGTASSIFNTKRASVNLASLEGESLYDESNVQCLNAVADVCKNDAFLNMARSSYSIMITQDCNAYAKKVDAQREAVQQTVRTAEKYLREARLEEYRAHNSQDVNECLNKVRTALLADTACGANYARCLDYSGAYINPATGEPVYSQRLFQLADLITLDGASGSIDLLGQNEKFNEFLESKRMFAKQALDTCRDMSEMVWAEFKRNALIEIAQAQDAKIEEVKASCVSTIKQCYDTQTTALRDFDETTAQAAGALSAYAAKAMCQEKVSACASLYGDTNGCVFDGNGRLTKGNNNGRCGLTALLAYVDSVDRVRVAEGCDSAIENYLESLCTPTSGQLKYPLNCRFKELGDVRTVNPSNDITASLAANVKQFALDNCADPTADTSNISESADLYAALPAQTRTQLELKLRNIQEEMATALMQTCQEYEGLWMPATMRDNTLLASFYNAVYGGDKSNATWGRCVENTVKTQCESYNTTILVKVEHTDEVTQETTEEVESEVENIMAVYDAVKDECKFTDAWYQERCVMMGNSVWQNGACYVKPK